MDDDNIIKDKLLFSPCIICGCDSHEEICDIAISPLLISSKLVRCKECGFYYANPRLKEEVEEEHYKKRYHENENIDYWYEGRIDVFKRSFHEISKFVNKGSLLDVGCGMGYFMDLARNNGWEVKGVEISDSAVNYAKEKLGLDVIKADLRDTQLETDYFDVATMWNVLDQIYDPRFTLIELNRILKKEGYLFMRVSNLNFHLGLLRLYNGLKHLFRGIKSPPVVFHLYSFDKNSIKRLLNSTGFSKVIVKTESLGVNQPYILKVFGKKIEGIIRKLFDLGASVIYLLSFGKIIISPSLFVIART